ncbi:hypothetical protein BH09PSE2_BH09PSE2_18990 [soil metagenome]
MPSDPGQPYDPPVPMEEPPAPDLPEIDPAGTPMDDPDTTPQPGEGGRTVDAA